MQENLAGVRVVKAFSRMRHEIARFGQANDSLMAQNIFAVRTSSVTMPLMLLALNTAVVAAVWFGGLRVKIGDFQVGQLIAFINYLGMSLMALIQVSMMVVRVARAAASSERIEQVLNETAEISNYTPRDSKSLKDIKLNGRLAFENVSFTYRSGEREPVLRDISFVAEPGQTIAILGATGSGKSSLVNLIPRFYDVSGGRVTLDGIDIR